MKKLQLFGLLALITISFSNCKKTADAGPAGATGAQGAPGPALMGNIKGFITTWDQYGARILANQAGDTVRIDGTNRWAITDSTGLYTLPGVITGTYNITVTKPGFGLNRLQYIQFVGGGDTYRDARISQPSTSNVTALADSSGAVTNNITVYGTIPADSHVRSFIVYVGNSASVSPNPTTYLIFNTKNVNANATKLSFTIPKSDLNDAGFVTGQTVYYAVFGINSGFNNASSFEDFTTGRTVFTAISNTPATTSMIMP